VTTQLLASLEALPGSLSDLDQRVYLDEALKCLRAEAWRSAIVMSWNLAYDHLCRHIIKNKLKELNIVTSGWKNPITIKQRSDLQELKEAVVLDACRVAVITDKTVSKVLKSRLDERNDAAHPSGRKFGQSQAEAFVEDVVKNVVLVLK